MRIRLCDLGISVLAAMTLAGCSATSPSVADIVRDKPTYLEKNFTRESVPSLLRPTLASLPAVDLPFKMLDVEFDYTTHRVDTGNGQTSDLDEVVKTRYVNQGGGLVQVSEDVFSNGIPVYLYFHLSYVNYLSFMNQAMSYGAAKAGPVTSWKSETVLNPDVAHPHEHATYEVVESDGKNDYRYGCTAATERPASQILAEIPGQALDFNCTLTRDGIVTEKQTLTFLHAYGIYVLTERDYANVVYRLKITKVTLN